jgi:hypothetical protein
MVSKVVSVAVVLGVSMLVLAGCSAETGDEDPGDQAVGTTADALSGLGPCPVCTSPNGCITGICIGTEKGATGCTEGAVVTRTKTVKPEAFIKKTDCTEWWDASGGEGYVYSRQCTQHAYRTLGEVGVCTPTNKKPGTQGPSINQWFYTVNAGERVKRTRGETETNFINPTSTAQPWSQWTKE